ncbi:SAM-dependent methyltransferase [Lactococcus raffinolactis]|uniref:SAM-dependent methyltransferase n=1 Tax=Pseudolactococcus raffinolactis TaxID=1366 RepID=UPI0039B11060
MKPILDVCCGSRMFYFDKENPNVEYCDIRSETLKRPDKNSDRIIKVLPDTIADFRALPFEDNYFYQVIFDPPHLINVGDSSWLKAKYGQLNKETWQDDIKKGFKECWRVLKPNGTLIFKWNDTDIDLAKLKKLFPSEPIIGQKRPKNKDGVYSHWLVFMKIEVIE